MLTGGAHTHLTQLVSLYATVCDGLGQNKIQRVSKNCAKFFLSELRQISTNFDNFWQKDGKEAKIMQGALIFQLT